jgi:hypothetical protein
MRRHASACLRHETRCYSPPVLQILRSHLAIDIGTWGLLISVCSSTDEFLGQNRFEQEVTQWIDHRGDRERHRRVDVVI